MADEERKVDTAAPARAGAGAGAGADVAPRAVLAEWRSRIGEALFQNVLPFWATHSPDREHGGWFDCLTREGAVYDRTKHVWLQGRQVWTFCRVYNDTRGVDVEALSRGKLDRDDLLKQASAGLAFLRKHATAPDTGHVFFALAADGRPAQAQRKPFSACFLAMALSEWARAVADTEPEESAAALAEAQSVVDKVVAWTRRPALLGKAPLAGAPALRALAVPMMVLCIVKDLVQGRPKLAADTKYVAIIDAAVAEIKTHIHADRKEVLENVAMDGAYVADSIDGRQLNPGHAIECGWFMLQHALQAGDDDLRDLAVQVVDWSFDRGWDAEHGGIFYFLDAAGHSPVQLEWNMKLWWPHCEALIAYALLYTTTRSATHLTKFCKVADYAFRHFHDADAGEWYGYLDRRGDVTHTFKGGPYKGCFHVPRALLLTYQILSDELDAAAPDPPSDE